MNIFLDSPRYEWGWFGFFTNPSIGKWILRIAGVASLVTLVFALGIYTFGKQEPKVPAQMVFLVAGAWLGVFGLFRLFATVSIKVFEAVTSLVEDAIPGLAGPLHYLIRAYWIVFEVSINMGFAWLIISANCLPFGLLKIDA